MNIRSHLILLTAALLLSASQFMIAAENCFVILKTGDEAATQENAAQFLTDLSRYLNARVASWKSNPVRGWITNSPDTAKGWMQTRSPAFAFVTPAFYLENLAASSTPLRQVPRFGADMEHYYIVSAKSGASTLEALKGKTIRTLVAAESKYLSRVVFPADFQPGRSFTLEKAANMADEVFLMTEKEKGAADALLFDEELLHFFKTDEMAWPQLKIVWTSTALPRDLVVAPKSTAPDQAQQIQKALDAMPADPEGARLLKLMQTTGFQPVNQEALNKARALMEKQ